MKPREPRRREAVGTRQALLEAIAEILDAADECDSVEIHGRAEGTSGDRRLWMIVYGSLESGSVHLQAFPWDEDVVDPAGGADRRSELVRLGFDVDEGTFLSADFRLAEDGPARRVVERLEEILGRVFRVSVDDGLLILRILRH